MPEIPAVDTLTRPWAAPRATGRARRPRLTAAVVVVGAMAVAALAAPWLAPYDPDRLVDPSSARYRPPGTVLAAIELADDRWLLADRVERVPGGLRIERRGATELVAESDVKNLTADGVADRRRFVLGSDGFGRDLLSRILYGGRVSLGIAVLAVALALTVGVLIGSLAAAGGRLLDGVLMRGVDALLAFPWLFLVLALTALFRPSTALVVLVLGGISWMGISRLVRAEIVSLREREFVLAVRGLGLPPWRILLRHLLPNALNPVLVAATLMVGDIILAESTLSFLGFGVQPPTASWGNLVADGREVLVTAWWVAAFPGLAIVVTVVAVNLLGDRLRDAMDPRG